MSTDIRALLDATPFVDTHEHLLEEKTRLHLPPQDARRALPTQTDFSVLFSHYANSDLIVAGMPEESFQRLADRQAPPADKWKLVAPHYARTRHTGYMHNVRESLRLLFGEDDIHAGNCQRISDRIAALIRPGYYRHVLCDVAKVEYTQVHTLETDVFMQTADPALLCQDINFGTLCTNLRPQLPAQLAQLEVHDLAGWQRFIDWCFATYGPRAIAIKSAYAYDRRLDYDDVPAAAAAPFASTWLSDPAALNAAQRQAVEDHLFNYCLRKSVEFRLPVKLHTGYYAGHGTMPLHRLRHNAGDLCPLLQRHPHARFVIMHMTYPYQDEAIALAKHYPNAYVDLCWAWIINPAATVRFVKEFLLAAPACKLLTFGGDYMPVEMVPGHAAIARQGLAQALGELRAEHWLPDADVPALVDRLMRGNAHDLFDYPGRLSAWPTPAPRLA